MSMFKLINPSEPPRIKPGTIMFLPPKSGVPIGAHTDPEMNEGAFNHPVTIVSCPETKQMKHNSLVEIAIMTSFNGTSIRKHLAEKGIKKRTGVEAAQHSGYLRVATASKPYALDTLKLRNGKGMKRDCSYVNIKKTYTIELRALALYGFGKEEVDAYCLTTHATKKLVEAILAEKEKRKGKKDKTKSQKEGKNPFEKDKWRGKDLKETKVGKGEGEKGDIVILVSPRSITKNPFRVLNPRAF